MLREGAARSEEELRDFNRTIVRLGEELGKRVVATGDVHFQEPEDEVYRHILLASKKFPDANAPLPIYFQHDGRDAPRNSRVSRRGEGLRGGRDQHPRHRGPDRETSSCCPRASCSRRSLENSGGGSEPPGLGQGATSFTATSRRSSSRTAWTSSWVASSASTTWCTCRAQKLVQRSLELRLSGRLARVGRLVARRLHVAALPRSTRSRRTTAARSADTASSSPTAATAAARICRIRTARNAARSTSRTASISRLRPSLASAAARCRILT